MRHRSGSASRWSETINSAPARSCSSIQRDDQQRTRKKLQFHSAEGKRRQRPGRPDARHRGEHRRSAGRTAAGRGDQQHAGRAGSELPAGTPAPDLSGDHGDRDPRRPGQEHEQRVRKRIDSAADEGVQRGEDLQSDRGIRASEYDDVEDEPDIFREDEQRECDDCDDNGE